jgi:hypothetical protein
MTQSRSMSLIEVTTNLVVGYVLAIAMQMAVFPLFGLEAAIGEHLAIGMAFVAVSLARGYVLRRLFERIRVASRSDDHGEHGEPEPRR